MKHFIMTFLMIAILLNITGCEEFNPTSDDIQRNQQEVLLKEATAQTGMPAVTNFRERKILKMIIELCDQDGIITYTYTKNEMTGRLVYFGQTIGYGIPYATQYTNPEQPLDGRWQGEFTTIPQADPGGLFKPDSAAATWILMKDPNGEDVKPVYIESDITVSPFKLSEEIADYK